MPSEDISGKLECVSCGAILMDIPEDADDFTVIRCAQCHCALGTWPEIQEELLRVRGAFDLDPGRVRRR